MPGKRKSREVALQVLFVWDANNQRDDELAAEIAMEMRGDDAVAHQRALDMARGAWDLRPTSDAWVERLAPQWPPRRQPGVDRNIIRLAIYELTGGDTPPKVAIDEAIELAKTFSTENSPGFVNGVLDAVLKEHNSLVDERNPNDETRMTNQTRMTNDETEP